VTSRNTIRVRDLPAATRRPFAAGERPPRRFEPVRGKDDRLHRVRVSVFAIVSHDRRREAPVSGPPTFNDLFFPDFSNPSLAPETSRNVEVGAYLYGSRARRKLGSARDRLPQSGERADRSRTPISFHKNVQRALLEGVTLGLNGRIGDTSITASLDLASPEDDVTGMLLPRRAREHGALAVLQTIGPFASAPSWSRRRIATTMRRTRAGSPATASST
jgi:hypothetical protein